MYNGSDIICASRIVTKDPKENKRPSARSKVTTTKPTSRRRGTGVKKRRRIKEKEKEEGGIGNKETEER